MVNRFGWASQFTPLEPARILLAERDPVRRARLARELRDAGYDVEAVATCERLSQALEEGAGSYALVVAGQCPCSGDAMRVLQELRSQGSATPFLVLTAYPDDLLRDAAFRLGARTFERPFRAIELSSYVRCLAPGSEPAKSWRGRPKGGERPAVAPDQGKENMERGEGLYEAVERKGFAIQDA